MARIYYDADADVGTITSKRLAIIGYGSQGRAHALNLRSSGCTVTIGLRESSPSRAVAEADGFPVETVEAAGAWADILALLVPDQSHRSVFLESVAPALRPGSTLLLAHGFSIRYGQVRPPEDIDVVLVAPVGPGSMLRQLYVEGHGIPAVFAVHQDASGRSNAVALAYASALGCTRAGVIATSFEEETETDLFGEQAVLCGGIPRLIRAGYDTLVGAGYQPELAYFECVHQVKLIVDLIYEGGIAGMATQISDTAEYGMDVSGPRIVDDHVRGAMQGVLSDIRDGTFARSWVDEWEAGAPVLERERQRLRNSPMEAVGARLRSMMSWLRRGPL